MRGFRRVVGMALLAAGLAGCAGTAKLPEGDYLAIAVSSGWGSGIGGDYEIPDSQVCIGGRASTVAAAMGGFGLFGAGIATAVDQYRNANDLKGASDVLRLKFNDIVATELRKHSHGGRPEYRFTPRHAEETSMLLFPFARFLAGGESQPQLTLFIEARFGERTKTSFTGRRDYVYLVGESRSMVGSGGWADQGGAAFRTATRRGFERLAQAFSDDMRGVYKARREAAATPRIRWQAPLMKEAAAGIVLAEYPEHVVIAPVVNDVVHDRVVVVERSLLRAD